MNPMWMQHRKNKISQELVYLTAAANMDLRSGSRSGFRSTHHHVVHQAPCHQRRPVSGTINAMPTSEAHLKKLSK